MQERILQLQKVDKEIERLKSESDSLRAGILEEMQKNKQERLEAPGVKIFPAVRKTIKWKDYERACKVLWAERQYSYVKQTYEVTAEFERDIKAGKEMLPQVAEQVELKETPYLQVKYDDAQVDS